MIKWRDELQAEQRESIRGGRGRAEAVDYLKAGDMAGLRAASRITLQPGASIGQHLHPDTEEFYLILEGKGTGYLDGEPFPVGPGDGFLVKAGHSHGLENGPAGELALFAILTGPSAA